MVLCSICGTKEKREKFLDGLTSVYALGQTYALMKCTGCETLFTAPQPTKAELGMHYESNYAFKVHSWVYREKLMRARGLIRASKIFRGDSKVLEIGTGGGELAREVAKHVLLVDGCEIDSQSVDRANSHSGVNVKCADIEDYVRDLPENFYDIAIFSHTLEHFIDPLAVLKSITPSLGVSAQILIVVPNRLASSKLFKRKWGYWQVPVHITHHSPGSIRILCEKAGLVVDQIKYRHSDFMALGSYLINIRNKNRSSDITNSPLLSHLIPALSTIYALTYRLGRQDMIVIASKKQIDI